MLHIQRKLQCIALAMLMHIQPNILCSQKTHKASPADYTFIVYMAADNDLRSFAARNIKQMAEVGSIDGRINIVIHLDIRLAGNKKVTRRYYISKGKIYHVNAQDQSSQRMDSGQPETLISCCKWAITDYPAQNYVLIFWNHGTGILDPNYGRILNPTELFSYNPALNMLELDRSVSILGNADAYEAGHVDTDAILNLIEQEELNDPDYAAHKEIVLPVELCSDEDITEDPRGICWDDSAGNYLNNQQLIYALKTVCDDLLNGGKFSIIGFDACLMSMHEVAHLIAPYAHVMVGSQEVELGTGWNYQKVLEPFLHEAPNKRDFARHIAHVYEETYNKITHDYTQSAVNLDDIQYLDENVNTIARLLIEALRIQKNRSVHNAIRASKNKLLCTHFDEPTYIDLHHLYVNLEHNLKHFSFTNVERGKQLIYQLRKQLDHGRAIIRKLVLANVCGKNLHQAHGISIYFPERHLHNSYQYTPFAANNEWIKLIQAYLTS